MKKIMFLTAFILANTNISFAGVMGSQTNIKSPLFISAEGAYTWNKINSITINSTTASLDKNLWGGRFGVGLLQPIKEHISFSSEAGLGYYGKTKRTVSSSGYYDAYQIYGLDLLAGAYYRFSLVDIFLKGGAMLQNEQVKTVADLNKLYPGGLFSGNSNITLGKLQLLPELKTGIEYNIMENLGITLAYMHVFGSNEATNITLHATSQSFANNQSGNLSNPTLDAVMLGLQYSI